MCIWDEPKSLVSSARNGRNRHGKGLGVEQAPANLCAPIFFASHFYTCRVIALYKNTHTVSFRLAFKEVGAGAAEVAVDAAPPQHHAAYPEA